MSIAPSIAIVGAGLVGQRHVPRIQKCAQLSAVVDPAPSAAEFARNAGVPHFIDIHDLLAAQKPEGLLIATPNHLHVRQALLAIEEGIPVLVEKPISDKVSDAEVLVEASEASGVPLLVGHHRRHNPKIAAAKKVVEDGRLGRLTAIQAQFWLYKPDDYFDAHWRQKEGAGPVFINLIHDIDLLRHLCGEVLWVQAMESRATRKFDVEDTAAIVMEFECGALATISVSDCAVAPWSWEFTASENDAYPHVPGRCYALGGTEASLSIPDMRLWRHSKKKGWWEPIDSELISVAEEDPFVRQIDHFCEVIRGKAEPLVSAREGTETLRVVEAIKKAAATGETVSIR